MTFFLGKVCVCRSYAMIDLLCLCVCISVLIACGQQWEQLQAVSSVAWLSILAAAAYAYTTALLATSVLTILPCYSCQCTDDEVVGTSCDVQFGYGLAFYV